MTRTVLSKTKAQAGTKWEWEKEFSLLAQPWLRDHCPSFTVPTMPFAFMVAEIVASGRKISGYPSLAELREVKVTSWLAFPEGTQRVRVSAELLECGEDRALAAVRLSSFHRVMGGREIFSPFCEGRVVMAPEPPSDGFSAPLFEEPVLASIEGSQIYQSGYRFSGPAFRILRASRHHGGDFWSADLELPKETPKDPKLVFPFLLDGLFQALPKEEWPEWHRRLEGRIGFPYRISSARFFGPPLQAGKFRAEVNFLGFEGDRQLPNFRLRLFSLDEGKESLKAELAYQEYLVPLGGLLDLAPEMRESFLRGGRYVPGVSLSEISETEARLKPEAIKQVDWLKGTVAQVYLESEKLLREYRALDLREAPIWLAERVAVKEYVAAHEGIHPRDVHLERLSDGGWRATSPALPYQEHYLHSEFRDGEARARRNGPPRIDLDEGLILWRARLGLSRSPVEVLVTSLIEKFLGGVVLEDPQGFAALRGRPALFLANHQTFVESFILNLVTASVAQIPVVFLAKREHRRQWIGRFEELCTTYPGSFELKTIHFVDREDPQALLEVVAALENLLVREHTSVVIHVEGRRSYRADDLVQKISSVWLDMSVKTGVPVVPIRIVGGLPERNFDKKYDFPVGYGRQRFLIGSAISAEQLAALPYVERARSVKAALNKRWGDFVEGPSAPDPEFQARTESFRALSGAEESAAVLWAALERHRRRSGAAPEGFEFGNPFDALIAAGEFLLETGSLPHLETSPLMDSDWFENLVAWLFGGKLRVEVKGQVEGYRLRA